MTCSAMSETYYERWQSLYHAEKRARREGNWEAWRRAAKRLADHENLHYEHPFACAVCGDTGWVWDMQNETDTTCKACRIAETKQTHGSAKPKAPAAVATAGKDGLNPCPLCGCDDVSFIEPDERIDVIPLYLQMREWRIWCPSCASYWATTEGLYSLDGKAIARSQWNRRPNAGGEGREV